jgi:hypothetical protein
MKCGTFDQTMEALNDDLLIELFRFLSHIDLARLMLTSRRYSDKIKELIDNGKLCDHAPPKAWKKCARLNHYLCLKMRYPDNLNEAIAFTEQRSKKFLEAFYGEYADICNNAHNICRGGHLALVYQCGADLGCVSGLIRRGDLDLLKKSQLFGYIYKNTHSLIKPAILSGNNKMIEYIYPKAGRDTKHILHDAIKYAKLSVVKAYIEKQPNREFKIDEFDASQERIERVVEYLASIRKIKAREYANVMHNNKSDDPLPILQKYADITPKFILDVSHHNIEYFGSDENVWYYTDSIEHSTELMQEYIDSHHPTADELETIMKQATDIGNYRIAFICSEELRKRGK